jgi:hypothetical protein
MTVTLEKFYWRVKTLTDYGESSWTAADFFYTPSNASGQGYYGQGYYGQGYYGHGYYGHGSPEASFVPGPDGFSGSALMISTPGVSLKNIHAESTITFWYNSTDSGEVVVSVDGVDIAPDDTIDLTVNGKVWKLAYILNVANTVESPLDGMLKFRSSINAQIKLFDIRIYQAGAIGIKTVEAIKNYFNDVKNNHANAYLPLFF